MQEEFKNVDFNGSFVYVLTYFLLLPIQNCTHRTRGNNAPPSSGKTLIRSSDRFLSGQGRN